MSSEVEGSQVIRLLFEPLVTLSPDLEVVPGVADEWSVADDGVTWTFELAESTFSDGTPVTADDFAFAFARAADPDLAAVASYQGDPIMGWNDVSGGEADGEIGNTPISGVTAVDDDTLQIVTTAPFALLPKVLTYPLFAPVPRAMFESDDAAAAFNEAPIGNGIYKMAGTWEHNVGITLERNPEYNGTPGVAETIEFRMYADTETAYRDFEAGNLDITRNIPPERIEAARELGDRYLETPTASLGYIGFPTELAPFDNPDIRRALSMAVDREAIAERVQKGSVAPATGMVPPNVPGALETTCDACVYDPEAAKALFDSAGGVPGNSIVVYDISDDGQATLEPVLNSWRDTFGIEIEVRSYEFAQYLEETTADALEGPFELGWVWDYPSGYSMLSPLFQSDAGANNLSWANAKFDSLMEQVRTAEDESETLALLGEAQAIVESEMPLIPVSFANDIGAHSDRLSNVVVDAGMMWRLELIQIAD